MNPVEITYRFNVGETGGQDEPRDASAALCRLNEGNRSFAKMFTASEADSECGRRVIDIDPRDVGIQHEGTAAPEQRPFAAILGCSDARVPVGLIFNEGPNDLFVVRVAGNTMGDDVRGSLNYALEHLGGSLKLLVVLGHSGCGAVTAAVDVYLNPSGYLALVSKHAIRMLVDRIMVTVHSAAQKLEMTFGSGIVHHPRYREALIEVTIIMNAALGAHTLQKQIGENSENGVRTAYGAYGIEERMIWAPRCGSDEVVGLASPPSGNEALIEFSDAVLRSQRIATILDSLE